MVVFSLATVVLMFSFCFLLFRSEELGCCLPLLLLLRRSCYEKFDVCSALL